MAAQTQFGKVLPKGMMKRVTDRVAKLGIIAGNGGQTVPKVRSAKLDLYDSYVESTQYDKLQPWESSSCDEGYVPIRKRKPRVVYDFPKRIITTFASKMAGHSVFPEFKINGTEQSQLDDNEFLQILLKATKLESILPEAMRRMGTSGSVLLRFRINDLGAIRTEVFNAKYCYPEFDDNGELTSVTIKYVYEDVKDIDKETGKPKQKWYRLDLGMQADVLFDNPEYEDNEEPIFSPVSTAQHDLGYVQAEWFRMCEDRHTVDGPSLLEGGVLSLFDEINYSLSQSSQAISYAQEPQVAFSGMDVDEIDTLVKSSTKGWNLGRDGKAEFIEANLGGVEVAGKERDKLRLAIQDVTRVVLHDPEKMSGTAQSGKALEQLNAPLVDLIMEVRPLVEARLVSLMLKIGIATARNVKMGLPAPVNVPQGYVPLNFPTMDLEWPPVFAPTQEDIQKKVQTAVQASNANLIARVTATKYIAANFGVTDIEAEQGIVDTQKTFNTFGGF